MSDIATAYDQQVTDQENMPSPEEISVAVLYPGTRIEKMAVPLKASRMDVAIEPDNPYQRDIVVVDNADTDLGKEVLKNPFTSNELVYRMRGDVYHELDLWGMNPVKEFIAKRVVLPNVDGCIAVTERLANEFQDKSGVTPVGNAGLFKRVDEWPTVNHTSTEIRAVTLTNANYWQKVSPLVDWAPAVDRVLDDIGGHWHICGDGEHATKLDIKLREYDHVSFEGFVDAKQALSNSNVMLHATALDGQPNSVLEGLASNLPVITNDWVEFMQFNGPLQIAPSQSQLSELLRRFQSPSERQTLGSEGVEYIENNHTPEQIGRMYETYFMELLHD